MVQNGIMAIRKAIMTKSSTIQGFNDLYKHTEGCQSTEKRHGDAKMKIAT